MSFESISGETPSPLVLPISTARLDLVAVTSESVLSEQAGDGQLSALLGCQITQDLPPKDWEPHVLEWLLKRFAEDPQSVRWCRYILLRDDGAGSSQNKGKPVLVGTLGAVPEFGYGVLPEFQRRGYATEAALAMVAWARETGQVDELVAHTYPELTASIKILERCGFVLEGPGEEERTIRYRLRL